MKILWICGLPYEVQEEVLGNQGYGAYAAWSWILGHLPPPEGIELHIACRTARHTSPQEFIYNGAHLHLVPVRTRARILCLFQFDWLYFRNLASRLNPDVIHGWGTEDAYALIALKLAPQQHLIQVQGNLNSYSRRVPMPWHVKLAAWSERIALARARHVVAENEYSLESAQPMIRTESIHIVEHPLRDAFLTATPADGKSKQILFVGNVEERKGIWDALDAFRRSAPTDWTLAIVGNSTRENIARLQRLIGAANLTHRVFHHPHLSLTEIVALMQVSSIFLLPTRIDTGPTALKEALAMGLWPVCYDNSGPGHYLRKFQCGDLAEDLNREALTEILRRAVAAQAWKKEANRAKIITEIRPHFDRLRIWLELAQLYRKICGL